MRTGKSKLIGIVGIAAIAVSMAAGVYAAGPAEAETRGCSSEQYIAWFNSKPEQSPHLHDGVMHYYDDDAFAAWWDARYCGVTAP